MRLETAGYSNRAGRAINCDALLWREREFGLVAALCSAGSEKTAAVSAARLASLRLIELAEEVFCADDAREALRGVIKEAGADGFVGSVFDAALLTVRGGTAVWAGAGSAVLAVFADGEIRRFGETPDITAAETEISPGCALLAGSDGLWRQVSETECMIDLCKSQDAAQWLDYLLLRHLERSQLGGDSVSALLCIADE